MASTSAETVVGESALCSAVGADLLFLPGPGADTHNHDRESAVESWPDASQGDLDREQTVAVGTHGLGHAESGLGHHPGPGSVVGVGGVEEQRVGQHHVAFLRGDLDDPRPAVLVQEGAQRLIEVVGFEPRRLCFPEELGSQVVRTLDEAGFAPPGSPSRSRRG